MSDNIILAVDTSCDDTSAAVIENGKVISSVVSSQLEMHNVFGGVVPEIAARSHQKYMWPVINEALEQAGKSIHDIEKAAVTFGPGLVGALLVGLNTVKAFGEAMKIPVIPVNHMVGHVYSLFIENEPEFPFVVLIVSGGHTQLVEVIEHGRFRLHGETRDDAAGEAFDKVAKMLGLGYPGGPAVEKTALNGKQNIDFPQALDQRGNYEFSYSGLKTAVVQFFNKNPDHSKEDICNSFQHAAIHILAKKTFALANKLNVKTVAVCGGVAANGYLRKLFQEQSEKTKKHLILPSKKWCTDNAAMIGMAAHYCENMYTYSKDLNANAGLDI